MSPGVMLQYTRNQLNSLTELVKEARTEGPFQLDAEDYRDLVTLVLNYPETYHRTLDFELRRLFTERPRGMERLQQLRSELAELADRSIAVVRIVEEDPRFRSLVPRYSFLHELPARLAEAVASLQSERTRLHDNWPVCSPEELEQSRVESARGQSESIEQAFAAMTGISLDDLHRKLEEHKARRKEYGWE